LPIDIYSTIRPANDRTLPARRTIIYGLGAHDSNPGSHIFHNIWGVSLLHLKKDLKIRGIHLPYIVFSGVLGLFDKALKPYHLPAVLITGIVRES
jgi:hypothetical protein